MIKFPLLALAQYFSGKKKNMMPDTEKLLVNMNMGTDKMLKPVQS